MRGATLHDWVLLTQFDNMRKRVYNLDSNTLTVGFPIATFEQLHPGALPWNVILLLGKYHRKHIFLSNRIPSIELAMKDVGKFTTRLGWKWFFRNDDSKLHFKVRRRPCAPPKPELLPSSLRVWTQSFKYAVHEMLGKAQKFSRVTTRDYSNTVGIEVDALRWIQTSDVVPIPTDKDGGYCVVLKEFVRSAHTDILSKPWYEEIDFNIASWYNIFCAEYRKLAGFVADKTGLASLRSQICRTLVDCTAKNLPRKLALTVKTHKPPGLVSCRNLHVGGQQPFSGLSAWVGTVLKTEILVHAQHLVTNSSQLVQFFRTAKFDRPVKFVKLDIREFFMKGTEEDFSRGVKLLPATLQEPVGKSISFLLRHQFVSSDVFPGRTWRVVSGSGMGLVHSSELCDFDFFAAAEHRFVTNPRVLQKFGIFNYFRFRDDILLLCDAQSNECGRFLSILRTKAQYVQIQMESFSFQCIQMLDLNLRCFSDGTVFRIGFEPFFKPTSLLVPLSTRSGHHWNVHVSWPFSQIRRFARLSSTRQAFETAKAKFVQRFVEAGEPIVEDLRRFNPWNSTNKSNKKTMQGKDGQLWLCLPYHPVWALSGVQRRLNDFVYSEFAQGLWRTTFSNSCEIRVAWRNHFPFAQHIFCELKSAYIIRTMN